MQWAFLVLTLWAALVELHTGTFYLAAIAAVAAATVILGFWLPEEWLLATFILGCAAALLLVWALRRHRRAPALPDLDLGQDVEVVSVQPDTGRLTVRYRGSLWNAAMETGAPPPPGGSLRIVRRSGSLLHLAPPATAAPPVPIPETP
ncbi:MAG: hypothetical protein KGI51_09095 [Rhodospirillales bacterium]|nr:hypothetical protein [Rhodospirillales bacterium]